MTMTTKLYKLSNRQKDKLKELAKKFRWDEESQKSHEEHARRKEFGEYPYDTPCGCYGHPHCGCDDPYYCPEEQEYYFLEWESVWDEEKQKVVEIQVDVRDKPEPIFRGFEFSFCDKHGVNWEDVDCRYPSLNEGKEELILENMFRPTQTPVEFYFDKGE